MDFFLLIFFIFYKKEFVFAKKENLGEKLLKEISFLQKGEKRNLPEYKFFTKILNHLLEQKTLYGVYIDESLLIIKKALIEKLEFERKKKESFLESFAQFFLILFFINVFFFMFKMILTIKISYTYIITINTFLVSIIGIFFKILKYIHDQTFCPLENFFEKLLLYRSLFQGSISLGEMNELLEMHSLQGKKELKEKFFFLLERLKNEGVYEEKDWNLLEEELKITIKESMVSFHKKAFLGRFLCIFFFFLPSYFFLVYSIFNSVLL